MQDAGEEALQLLPPGLGPREGAADFILEVRCRLSAAIARTLLRDAWIEVSSKQSTQGKLETGDAQ